MSPHDKEVKSRLKGVQPERREKVPLAPDLVVSATGSFPDFIYRGGPVIQNPQLYILFIGDWSSTANQTRARRLRQFVTDLLKSQYMNILSQYGVGTTGTVINSVFIPSSNHDLSNADIINILQTAINNNTIPEPVNPSTAYVLFLDDATAVNDTTIGVVMCEASSATAFGYHYFFTTTAGNQCVFSVIPNLTDGCLTNSCDDDARCVVHLGQTQEQRLTQVTSHELAEMFSDPLLNAWTSPTVGENGDICNGYSGTITVGTNVWTVQYMYSKWHDMNTNGFTTCILETPNLLPSLLPT
jgi:hypothetical protein